MRLTDALTDDLLRRMGNPKAALESLIYRRIFGDSESATAYLRAAFFDFGRPLADFRPGLAAREERLLRASIKTNRRRIRHIVRIVKPRPGELIVDAGCGTGALAFHLAGTGARAVAFDVDCCNIARGHRIITQAGGSVQMLAGSCDAVPLREASADKIVCANVFEHLAEKGETLSEFRRVLKPGGMLFVYTDNLEHVRARVWIRRLLGVLTSGRLRTWNIGFSGEPGGHVGLVTPRQMVATLREVGFESKVVYSLPALPIAGRFASRFFCAVAYKPAAAKGAKAQARKDNGTPAADDLAAAAVARRRAFARYLMEGPVPRLRVMYGRDLGSGPRLTIAIPTADGDRDGNLARLLNQLAEQTFQQFEVIVVEGDSRQGRAINTAAAIARGELLVTMDDDTRLGHADLLERIVRTFAADLSIGMAGVSNLPPPHATPLARRAMRELPRRSSALVDRITDSDMVEHPCLAIRAEIFRRIGGEHELIPRGLDPYLRREVRRLGYRVVVIPQAWIHHLLPPTLAGILRQYFRNGVGAAYVQKFYPAFVIDQATDHAQPVPRSGPVAARARRYLGRWLVGLATQRWIYLACMVSYGLGYLWGMRTLAPDSL